MSQLAEGSESRDPLKHPVIQEVVKFILCRTFQPDKHYEDLIELSEDVANVDSIKEALLYLEHSDWNVGEAQLRMELDHIDRAGPAREANRNEIDRRAMNKELCREFAKTGDRYNHALSQIDLNISQESDTRTFSYQFADTLDKNSQEDINDLNRWRHRIFREYVGVEKTQNINGIDFHPLERDYLLNRYAAQKIDKRGQWGSAEVFQGWKSVFEGTYLPGRAEPCKTRPANSLFGFILRETINSKRLKKGTMDWSRLQKHEWAQEIRQEEWKARVAANDQLYDSEESEDEDDEDDEDNEDDGDSGYITDGDRP